VRLEVVAEGLAAGPFWALGSDGGRNGGRLLVVFETGRRLVDCTLERRVNEVQAELSVQTLEIVVAWWTLRRRQWLAWSPDGRCDRRMAMLRFRQALLESRAEETGVEGCVCAEARACASCITASPIAGARFSRRTLWQCRDERRGVCGLWPRCPCGVLVGGATVGAEQEM